jgi:hypothetical protein
MIQYDKDYVINGDDGKVTFSKINKNIVAAIYFRGTITAKWDGDILKGKFYDAVGNGYGLIEFKFNENGFDGKWKGGLEEGPMKGKWDGKIQL